MLRKTVIPAAGFGTRMLPAAKAVPKEMLPVLDRPTIQHVVEESAAAGAIDVLIVTSRDKKAIEDHFDRHPELEQRLKSSDKEGLLASIRGLMSAVRITTTRQREQRGLGHAVLQAREHVGRDPFHCLLGDTVFSGGTPPAVQLAAAHARLGTALIGLQEVSPDKVERYGIVAGDPVEPGVLRITDLVEKPRRGAAPSHLAIAARYVLTPAIFTCLDIVEPGRGGEIQLTDALRLLLKREPVHGVILSATRHDIGDPTEWLRTNLIFAARDPVMWASLRATIERLARG
jgi:UTP--glucose-1-phosphate uridylyltransferase